MGRSLSRLFSALALRSRVQFQNHMGSENYVRRLKAFVSASLVKSVAAHLNAKFDRMRSSMHSDERRVREDNGMDRLLEALLIH